MVTPWLHPGLQAHPLKRVTKVWAMYPRGYAAVAPLQGVVDRK